MSVIIASVERGSPAYKAGIKAGDTLVRLNGNDIVDVLDYRFYQSEEKITAEIINSKGKIRHVRIKKQETEELGMLFDTYLMDSKHSCRNKCIFCFIDQLPRGLRESLYFKDDDSRLSFLFGNYITLTNITEHEIERIIKMHISPINISVHTTNPELRVKMMANKNAGKVLDIIKRFDNAGIKMNSQLVLCPDYNDGDELQRTLTDLTALRNMECIAAVPVGITKYREGLPSLSSFDKETAKTVLDTIDEFGVKCIEKYGNRRVYASDEFYILAGKEMPDAAFYGDFLQLENGVGLCALLKSEAFDALSDAKGFSNAARHISIATGVDAFELIREIVDKCEELRPSLRCDVFAIKNNFFGEKITVSGLVTATDIKEQLKDKDLGVALLIPSAMLRAEGDMFLDSVTLDELSDFLNVPIIPVNNDGFELVNMILETN